MINISKPLRRSRTRWLFLVAAAASGVLASGIWWLLSGNSEEIRLSQDDPRVQAAYIRLLGCWRGRVSGRCPSLRASDQECHIVACGSCLLWCRIPFPVAKLIIDPTCVPKQLDAVSGDWRGKGIYKLDGDTLQIAVAESHREDRPTSFSSDLGNVCIYDLRRVKLESVEYYERKLLDQDFVWRGPAPYGWEWNCKMAPAAFALAFIGDAAVPALFRAIKNPAVDVGPVCVALDAIGIPTEQFLDELRQRDTTGVEKWWAENRKRTAISRSKMRVKWELPPVEGVDWQAITQQPKWSKIVAITTLFTLLVAVAGVIVLKIRRSCVNPASLDGRNDR